MEEVACASNMLESKRRGSKIEGLGGKDDEALLVENETVETTADESGPNYPRVAYSEIFQFASRCDLVLFTIGIFAAIMQGGSKELYLH